MRPRILALLACALVVLVACDGGTEEPPAPEAPSSPVTGVILEIDSESIDGVNGFTVRAEGQEVSFVVDPDADYGFPLSHLQTHLTSSQPVTVEFEERDGELVATSIEDA